MDSNRYLYTEEERQALEQVEVYLQGKRLSFRKEYDATEFKLAQNDWSTLEINYPAGRLDSSALTLGMDYDPILGVVPIRCYTPGDGLRRPEQNWLFQFFNQRFIGEYNLVLLYRGREVDNHKTTVTCLVDDKTKQELDYMRETLEEQNSIILDFYSLTRERFHWANSSQDLLLSLEKFALLRQYFEQSINVARRIASCPLQDIARSNILIETGRCRRPDWSALQGVAHFPGQWQKYDGCILPGRVPSGDPKPRVDIAENIFVRSFLSRLGQEIAKLKIELREEKDRLKKDLNFRRDTWREQTEVQYQRLSKALMYSEAMLEDLHRLLNYSFWGMVPKSETWSATHRMKAHPLYREIWQLASDFSFGIRLAEQTFKTEGLHLHTRGTNSLYEHWLAMTIAKLMANRFHMQMEKKNHLDAQQVFLNFIMRRNSVLQFLTEEGLLLEMYFNKLYPPLMGRNELLGVIPAVLYGLDRMKNCPDISLEFWKPGNNCPCIITIDATYSRNPEKLREKHHYMDTIRFREWSGQPQEEWKEPVIQTWVVYPGPTGGRSKKRATYDLELGCSPGPGIENILAEQLASSLELIKEEFASM